MLNSSNESQGLSVVGGICVQNKSSNRAKILEYEEIVKELPQVDIPVNHHIHGGMYGREITIPAGTVITGSTDTGETKRLTGFNLFKGMSGKKRAGYAHKDTHWITFHSADGDNGDEIQNYITSETFDELENFHVDINRADYFNFVNESGMTQEQIIEQVENMDDMINDELEGVYISDSVISGKGLFSNERFCIGDVICQARINDKRTLAGRYSNHAVFANAEIKILNGSAEMIAIRDIEKNEEVTVNYRDVIKNRLIEGDLLCQE